MLGVPTPGAEAHRPRKLSRGTPSFRNRRGSNSISRVRITAEEMLERERKKKKNERGKRLLRQVVRETRAAPPPRPLRKDEQQKCVSLFEQYPAIDSEERLIELLRSCGQELSEMELQICLSRIGFQFGKGYFGLSDLGKLLEVLKGRHLALLAEPDLDALEAFTALGGNSDRSGLVSGEALLRVCDSVGGLEPIRGTLTRLLAEHGKDGHLEYTSFGDFLKAVHQFNTYSESEGDLTAGSMFSSVDLSVPLEIELQAELNSSIRATEGEESEATAAPQTDLYSDAITAEMLKLNASEADVERDRHQRKEARMRILGGAQRLRFDDDHSETSRALSAEHPSFLSMNSGTSTAEAHREHHAIRRGSGHRSSVSDNLALRTLVRPPPSGSFSLGGDKNPPKPTGSRGQLEHILYNHFKRLVDATKQSKEQREREDKAKEAEGRRRGLPPNIRDHSPNKNQKPVVLYSTGEVAGRRKKFKAARPVAPRCMQRLEEAISQANTKLHDLREKQLGEQLLERSRKSRISFAEGSDCSSAVPVEATSWNQLEREDEEGEWEETAPQDGFVAAPPPTLHPRTHSPGERGPTLAPPPDDAPVGPEDISGWQRPQSAPPPQRHGGDLSLEPVVFQDLPGGALLQRRRGNTSALPPMGFFPPPTNPPPDTEADQFLRKVLMQNQTASIEAQGEPQLGEREAFYQDKLPQQGALEPGARRKKRRIRKGAYPWYT